MVNKDLLGSAEARCCSDSPGLCTQLWLLEHKVMELGSPAQLGGSLCGSQEQQEGEWLKVPRFESNLVVSRQP